MKYLRLAPILLAVPFAAASSAPVVIPEPSEDRWMYTANATPGSRAQAATFSALPDDGNQEDRWGFLLVAFDTTAAVPAGLPPDLYHIKSISLRATTGQADTFRYDPTYDPIASYGTPSSPAAVADIDPGRPVELHGAGFRNGFTAASFTESSNYGFPVRNAYPLGFDANGQPRDVSFNVSDGFESMPWAVGTTTDAAVGSPVGTESEFHFVIDPSLPGVDQYLRNSLVAGKLWLSLSSLHPAIQQAGQLASWITRDDAGHIIFGELAPQLTIDVGIKVPLSIASTPAGPTLSWPQFDGFTFNLQASTSLNTSSDWPTIHRHAATSNGIGTYQDTSGANRRFYRLQFFPTP